jgi:glycosyltransferase involved in cell wall biosynthesis
MTGSVVQLLLGTEGGGIITAIEQWAPLLIEAGWPMHFVLLAESKAAEMLRAVGLKTDVITLSRIGRYTRLAAELKASNPAIIHCHNPSSHLMARGAARQLGAKLVRTVHADMFHEMRGTQPAWKIWLWKQAMQRILPRTDLLTVVRPHLVPLLPGIRGDEPTLKVMPNGFDPASIDADQAPLPAELTAWLGEAPMVLAMGRLVAVKNFTMLLRAWQQVVAKQPDAKLILAGSGPQEAKLKELARELQLEPNVRFVGWISAVGPYLRRASVIAISSRSECCPMLVFEAMAARKPVVATRVGGLPYLVTDGREGLLVADDDAVAFGAAVSRLLSGESETQQLGENGHATLERRFGHRVVAAQLAQSYNGLFKST